MRAFSLAAVGTMCLAGSAGASDWVRHWGGACDEYIEGVAADSHGRTYLAGTTCGFGSDIDWRILVLKYDGHGTPVWQRTWDRTSEQGTDVAVDQTGRIYVSGFTAFAGNSGMSPLLLAYSSSGDVLWARRWPFEGLANRVVVDRSGAVFVAGSMESNGRSQLFLTKVDKRGHAVFTKSYAGSDFARGNVVLARDSAGLFIGGGTGTTVMRVDSLGRLKWARQFGPGDGAGLTGMAVAPDGGLYVSGIVEVPGTGADVALTRIDANGSAIWRRAWGGTNSEHSGEVAEAGCTPRGSSRASFTRTGCSCI